ncbi:hypothetical protein MAPG_00136 [Magnaporthiopsis poae ATCC 64411]|uniref:Rhodopsin domain-containing protein n=1 Tax=Magnaporthiopsis poae (strain ATCC 64411 / 73-15) TaxID=644358 RepID=A0A0C4DK73_MAGP6|nr:hypothetical protein MAPG_00136 [Magnaporthiopsis poae ATCC 64411]
MGWVDNASPEIEELSEYRLIIAISVLISVLSISVVCARLYIRHTNHGLGADDHMATLSMFFALFYSIICIVQTKYGLGLPLALRPKPNLIPYTRWNYAGRPIYQMGISFFKVALLISYLRLFQGTSHRGYRAAVWITIVAVVLGHLGCSLCLVLACNPVYKSWEPLVPGTCLAPGPSFTGYAIVTIVSDIAVTIIPLPVLIKLNVSRSKKLGLVFIFVLGIFTTICSVLRYLQIDRIQYGDGNSTMLVLWGVIEFNVGNMVSSLPFLAPVFLRRAKEYRSRYQQGSGGPSGSGRNRAGSQKLGSFGGGGGSGSKPLYKTDDPYMLETVTAKSSGSNKKGGSRGDDLEISSRTSSPLHTTDQNRSEEEILKGSSATRAPHNNNNLNINNGDDRDTSQHLGHGRGASGIMKSVTYSVRVDQDQDDDGTPGRAR